MRRYNRRTCEFKRWVTKMEYFSDKESKSKPHKAEKGDGSI
jgi:hypothetical protein